MSCLAFFGSCCGIAPDDIVPPDSSPSGKNRASGAPAPPPGPSLPGHVFSLKDLKDATGNFDDSCLLGEGVLGKVYQGRLRIPGENQSPRPSSRPGSSGRGSAVAPSPQEPPNVAIKRVNEDVRRGITGFLAEVSVLTNMRDCENIVQLIGYCLSGPHCALVYPLYPSGSLERHLFVDTMNTDGVFVPRAENDITPALTWQQRMHVALGVCHALRCLHERRIVHRDLKPSNILLDDSYKAVVTDFGLARSLEETQTDTQNVSTTTRLDRLGYLDPAYATSSTLTIASDVYSLGVLLLELLTGRRAKVAHLVPWVNKWHKQQRGDVDALRGMMDPRLGDEFPVDGAVKVAALARRCVNLHMQARPTVGRIVGILEEVAQSM